MESTEKTVDLDQGETPPENGSVSSGFRGRKYAKEQAEYAAIFDVDVRTIKRWVKSGRDASPPDMPPLDDPARMPEWWARVMENRCPRKIHEAAARARKSTAADPRPLSPALSAAPAAAAPPADDDGKVGIAAALDRMQREERAAHRRYEQACQPDPDSGEINQGAAKNALAVWMDLAEKMRALEKSSVDVLAASGETLRKHDVRAALVEIHANIAAGVRNLFRAARPLMPGIDKSHAREQDAIFDAEVDRLFEQFHRSEFAAVLELTSP